MQIDNMQQDDWVTVRNIYGQGLATGLAAFMSVPPNFTDWDKGHLALGRLVARITQGADTGKVIGWAALAPAPDN